MSWNACVKALLLAGILLVLGAAIPRSWGQNGSQGTVTVTVRDQSGSLVPGAQLVLEDLATNDIRKAETEAGGSHTFVNLSLGRYRLTISKTGFETALFTSIVAQAAQTTDISATLKVGAITETVQVDETATPVVEESSNAISTTVNMKQIEDLPIQGRDLTQLSQLVPGYTGTWDGLPSIAQGNNIDGVIGSSSRMKFGGNAQAAISPRLEDMQEMTVQTEQLNLDQGYGQSNMQINFVTRRGSNAFHGRVFEDFRNAALNANSWFNDAATSLDPGNPIRKNPLILNDFGASVGGPIIKNKLFFFGTFAESRQPGSINAQNYVFTPSAQAGVFTYTGSDNQVHTVNVLQTAGGMGFPSTINASTASILQAANTSLTAGNVTPNALGDPNLQQINWQIANPIITYFPTVRIDFNATSKMRFNVAWNMTKSSQPQNHAPDFPGSDFAKTGAGDTSKNYSLGFGFDYTISPTLINQFRGGFLYNASISAYNASPLSIDNPQLGWNYTNVQQPFNTQMSGTNFYTATGTYYPIFNASDTMTWQHGKHTMNYGFSWWRELDHYYNGVLGFPVISLGLSAGDPALGAFSNTGANPSLPGASNNQLASAEQLYAILVGRIGVAGSGGGAVSGSYTFDPKSNSYCQCLGAYNLDELEKAWGVFFQDSYRIKPHFTLNYGLRWDFTGADKDLSNLYHSASASAVWGPSGINNAFNPGSLKGDQNPLLSQISQPYNNWNVSPQPAIGIAWNPQNDNRLGKMLGGDKTVIRAGFSLRKFTEPQQYVWDQATDYGSFYYQSFFLNANSTGGPASFAPGSLALGDSLPAFGLQPAAYVKNEPISDFTFLGGPGLNGIQHNIQQPYTESWNFGVQHQIGDSRALEVRYVGSLTQRQWLPIATDEVNIFENGFLSQFKNAQANLAINQQNGITSFANNGLPGQTAVPIFDAAFAGETAGGAGIPLSDYGASNFITDLTTGQAGAMASTLAGVNGTVPYFCNLVGAAFSPCANNIGFAGAGAGYPINYFQTNPYAQGTGFGYPSLTMAQGYSNYNALQVDFRQRSWHGLQFDVNYTWGHTLGTASQNNWQGQGALFTIRDMRLSYGPALFDVRHVIHGNATFDLPFGKGKQFANRGGVLDRIVGGWTIGTIFAFQTGTPFLLQGNGNLTFNDFADAGVDLHGVTVSQLQSAVGVYHIPGTTNVSFLNPKYLATPQGGGANPAYITPNTTPGTIGQRVWLYGPHYVNDDMAITKNFAITERVRFNLQAEMLNAFNHPQFAPGVANGCTYYCFNGGFSPNVLSPSFGIGGTAPSPNGGPPPNYTPRIIELRANVEF